MLRCSNMPIYEITGEESEQFQYVSISVRLQQHSLRRARRVPAAKFRGGSMPVRGVLDRVLVLSGRSDEHRQAHAGMSIPHLIENVEGALSETVQFRPRCGTKPMADWSWSGLRSGSGDAS